MAIRTTVSEVKEIITTSVDVRPFITTASLLVDEKLSGEASITAAHLKEIEKWLTAHFISASVDRQVSKTKAGASEDTYAGTTGMGLKSTSYGQAAIILDTTGTLSNLGKKRARVDVIEAIDTT